MKSCNLLQKLACQCQQQIILFHWVMVKRTLRYGCLPKTYLQQSITKFVMKYLMTFYSFQVMNKVSVNTHPDSGSSARWWRVRSVSQTAFTYASPKIDLKYHSLLIPFVPSTDASIINSYWEKSCALNADSWSVIDMLIEEHFSILFRACWISKNIAVFHG